METTLRAELESRSADLTRLQRDLQQARDAVQLLQTQSSAAPSAAHVARLERRLKVLEALTPTPVEDEEGLEGQLRLSPVEAALKGRISALTSELVQLKVSLPGLFRAR